MSKYLCKWIDAGIQRSRSMKQMPEELVDQLLKGYEKPENLLGREGLLVNLQKAVLGRALEAAELTAHLRYDRHESAGAVLSNAK